MMPGKSIYRPDKRPKTRWIEYQQESKIKVIQPVWQSIREHLESKKNQIAEEILYYPPPIPACDVQFNFLLAERARLAQALAQLDGLMHEALPTQDEWREFVSSLPELDAGVVEMLYAAVAE
jgi:hypothetical protein